MSTPPPLSQPETPVATVGTVRSYSDLVVRLAFSAGAVSAFVGALTAGLGKVTITNPQFGTREVICGAPWSAGRVGDGTMSEALVSRCAALIGPQSILAAVLLVVMALFVLGAVLYRRPRYESLPEVPLTTAPTAVTLGGHRVDTSGVNESLGRLRPPHIPGGGRP